MYIFTSEYLGMYTKLKYWSDNIFNLWWATDLIKIDLVYLLKPNTKIIK